MAGKPIDPDTIILSNIGDEPSTDAGAGPPEGADVDMSQETESSNEMSSTAADAAAPSTTEESEMEVDPSSPADAGAPDSGSLAPDAAF